MSYVVFARRYRPQNLEEIIVQEHITRTLKNAITENRVAHAYLFSGPRGVGKTTTARILAKALNCKNPNGAEPCGKCANCLEITAGSSLDVQEIDGASNRGIDEIRALRDNIKFAPASSKYKIYIIDEAHQITDAAFNALLKTLEEPPPHVVFILATTESQKIPLTILSRCQRYRFRLLSAKEITSTLKKIIDTEGHRIDDAALEVVTASAGGSMRDALSLLDQVISFSSGDVTAKDIQELLGFLPKEIITGTTNALAGSDLPKLLEIVRDISEQGYNVLQFARDLREHLRYILLYSVNPAVVDLPVEEKKILETEKSLFTKAWLIRAGRLLSRALDEMRWNDQPRLILELYLLKLAQPYVSVSELVERLEKIEQNIPYDESEPPELPIKTNYVKAESTVQAAPAVQSVPARDVDFGAEAPVRAVKEAPMAGYSSPQDAPTVKAPSSDLSFWNAVVTEVKKVKPIIGNVLTECVPRSSSDTIMILSVANNFQLESLKRSQQYIEDEIFKKSGRKLGIKVVVEQRNVVKEEPVSEEIVVEEEEEQSPPPQAEMFNVEADLSAPKEGIPPGLEKIMNKFPGKITKKK
jgi:DNA polymerase-3 subunit gamma/tau